MSLPEHYPNPISEVLQYTPPELYTGKEWYVGFYAFDPALNRMHRKKIKLNFIKGAGARRVYARGLIKRLNTKLEKGWNPWIEATNSKAFHTIEDVLFKYRKYLDKMLEDEIYREDTHESYTSYARNMDNWNNERKDKVIYIYQFDETFVQQFLEHIYIERDNVAVTRNNYLSWMKTFSTWLVQNRYLKSKPTEGFSSFGKKSKKKKRHYIEPGDMMKIKTTITNKNKHFLLACYILFYCFVRPKEMSKIKIKHISITRQTLFVPDSNSKNRNDGVVTIPVKVMQLMIDLDIFSYPGEYYLFSYGLIPGREYRDNKQFRDFWGRHVRQPLKLPKKYQFYSLKDTGITSMLMNQPAITVRDQARHSSLLETDTYTPHEIQEANDLIKSHNSEF